MTSGVYNLIADDLRQRIASGQLAPGDAVPTEGELAERWSTSRGPIRNALAQLRSEGLIETTRGRPSRVVERKAHQAVDVSVPFTRWVEDLGARPGARTESVALRKAGPDRAAALGVSPDDLVVDVRRLRFIDGTPTMLERLTFIEPVGRCLFDVDLDTVSITEYLAEHGFGSQEVDHEIDAVAANDVDASLLGLEQGWPLLRLRRIARDGDGRTIESSDDRYRSDIVRFTVAASGRSSRGDHYLRAVSTT